MIRKAVRDAASLFGVRVATYQAERFDPFVLQQQLVPRPSVIYDVGANIGQTTGTYRRTYPSAEIHSFEANPEAAEQISPDEQTHVHGIAVSDHSGEITLYVGDLLQEASVSAIPGATRAISVRCERLDALGLEPPQILKMDIEGHELAALRGAESILSMHRPLVYLEVSFTPRIPGGCLFGEVAGFLSGLDYVVAGLFNMGYDRQGVLVWSDAVFVPKSAVDRFAC